MSFTLLKLHEHVWVDSLAVRSIVFRQHRREVCVQLATGEPIVWTIPAVDGAETGAELVARLSQLVAEHQLLEDSGPTDETAVKPSLTALASQWGGL